MPQVSQTCRTLAAAVDNLMKGALSISEPTSGPGPCHLDSKLVLGWAPNFLSIDCTETSVPGLAAFVAAASALESVELACLTETEAAEADLIFSGSTSITRMYINMGDIPMILPMNLQHLNLEFEDVTGRPHPMSMSFDQGMVHSVLCRLVRLECLTTLVLNLGTVARLKSWAKLPALEDLTVVVWLRAGHSGVQYDLSWLLVQACEEVTLRVYVDSADPLLHLQLLVELGELQRKGLALAKLDMTMSVCLPPDLLQRWTALSVGSVEITDNCK